MRRSRAHLRAARLRHLSERSPKAVRASTEVGPLQVYEALDLALKREMQDLRDGNYSEEGMREFFRDMIADLNGMYEVMSMDPDLLNKG